MDDRTNPRDGEPEQPEHHQYTRDSPDHNLASLSHPSRDAPGPSLVEPYGLLGSGARGTFTSTLGAGAGGTFTSTLGGTAGGLT